ncbi:MAG: phosphoribosyltransferase family protein, partial [Acidimicrobiales bacterium]
MREFTDRQEAGRRLGARLAEGIETGVLVIGLPRGGVPVALEVARALRSPLDVIVVRKVGVPGHLELAMGAIGEDGVVIRERGTLEFLRISPQQFARAAAHERAELERRVLLYRRAEPPMKLEARTVIIVDDGLATGASAFAACEVARRRGAARLIVAVPVGSVEAVERMQTVAERVVSLVSARAPFAVGEWYESFDQTTDEEVIEALAAAKALGCNARRRPPLQPFGS